MDMSVVIESLPNKKIPVLLNDSKVHGPIVLACDWTYVNILKR